MFIRDSTGTAPIPITLDNSGSNVAGTFTVRYSTDSGSSYTTLTATSVAAGQTDSSTLSVPAQSHGTSVIIKYTVANTSEGLEPIGSNFKHYNHKLYS